MLPENVIRRHLRSIRLILSAAMIIIALVLIAWLDWVAGRAVSHEVGVVSIGDELYLARISTIHRAGGAFTDSNVIIARQWAAGVTGAPYPLPRGLPWTLAEVDAPYRARFRKASGTLSGPLRVDWRPPNAVQRSLIRWSPDGRSVEFARDRKSPYRGLGVRFHPGRALAALVRGLLVASVIAGIPIAVIWWLLDDRHWVSMRVDECPECGYDLRGSEGQSCPECGWGRSDQNATA